MENQFVMPWDFIIKSVTFHNGYLRLGNAVRDLRQTWKRVSFSDI